MNFSYLRKWSDEDIEDELRSIDRWIERLEEQHQQMQKFLDERRKLGIKSEIKIFTKKELRLVGTVKLQQLPRSKRMWLARHELSYTIYGEWTPIFRIREQVFYHLYRRKYPSVASVSLGKVQADEHH